MKSFVLFLPHDPDRYNDLGEDDFMEIIKDYVGWVEDQTEKGVYKGGHKLVDGTGKNVTQTATGIEVHDGPFTELAEVLGGLMVIEAADYDSAVAIAKTHPHLKHNKTIEIREIDDV